MSDTFGYKDNNGKDSHEGSFLELKITNEDTIANFDTLFLKFLKDILLESMCNVKSSFNRFMLSQLINPLEPISMAKKFVLMFLDSISLTIGEYLFVFLVWASVIFSSNGTESSNIVRDFSPFLSE